MLLEPIRCAEVLVEALPYIQSFRGKTVVIKYGGSAMEDADLMKIVLRDIVFLEAVGINPVLVHGGGKAITRRMDEKGHKAKFAAGLRITDEKTISIVEEILDTKINPDLVKKLVSFGGRAKSVSGKKVFQVKKTAPVDHQGEKIDIGLVGEITRCHTEEVLDIIKDEVVPVISPLGIDSKGQTYNINADVAAVNIAVALRAHKIVYLSDVNGILRDEKKPQSTISSLKPKDVEQLKREGILHGGMLPKVDSSLEALKAGISKIHLIDGRIPHALLLELFTDHGIGTEIIHG